jgi:hypothetical protein
MASTPWSPHSGYHPPSCDDIKISNGDNFAIRGYSQGTTEEKTRLELGLFPTLLIDRSGRRTNFAEMIVSSSSQNNARLTSGRFFPLYFLD